MLPDGSGLRQQTHSPVDKVHLSRADDGRILVNTNQGELLACGLDGGPEVPLDAGVRGMTDAVWSKNGERVLFSLSVANSVDANDIWLVEIADGSRRRLTNMKHMQHDPAWTQDERQVVFVSGSGGQDHDLFVLDVDTGALRQLTAGQRYHFEPACSAKGEIAFSSNRTGDYEIWVCDLEGKRFEQITHSPGLDAQPAWSPEGDRIAFVSARDGYPALWVVNRDGSNPRRISPAGTRCRGPVWSR
jgi:Tol biopolymer transport system component